MSFRIIFSRLRQLEKVYGAIVVILVVQYNLYLIYLQGIERWWINLLKTIFHQHYTSVGSVVFSKDMSELVAYPTGNPRNNYTIPDSVTSIGYGTFYNSNLEEIILPTNLTTIASNAFGWCTKLNHVIIPDKVTSIGSSAFAYCRNLSNVTIPYSLCSKKDELKSNCFQDCPLTNLTCESK